jgi:ferredoxin
MKRAEHEIRSNFGKLLKQKKIDVFIGYEKGTLPLRTSPCFVSSEKEARKLIWNSFCTNNLAVYLPHIMSRVKNKRSTRVGIICKGCDSRSLVELIKEKQLTRDQIYIIGISCSGMVDYKRILSQVNSDEVIGVDETADEITVRSKEGERVFSKEENLCEPCRTCKHAVPTVYDMLIRTAQQPRQATTSDSTVHDFLMKPREERWQILEQELGQCIRCYACRNACPNCYCKECFAEQTKPRWFGVTTDLTDIIFYHTIRIFHQAGRCVDCGACVRACPMNINLRLFTRMLVDEVKERFGYEPGVAPEELQPLATYSAKDKQDFMIEPE